MLIYAHTAGRKRKRENWKENAPYFVDTYHFLHMHFWWHMWRCWLTPACTDHNYRVSLRCIAAKMYSIGYNKNLRRVALRRQQSTETVVTLTSPSDDLERQLMKSNLWQFIQFRANEKKEQTNKCIPEQQTNAYLNMARSLCRSNCIPISKLI